jgi:hypothetical protein
MQATPPVDLNYLQRLIEHPEARRVLLRGYDDEYVVGIGVDERYPGRYVIVVQIKDGVSNDIPSAVTIKGERVPVVVRGGYEKPQKLGNRRAPLVLR